MLLDIKKLVKRYKLGGKLLEGDLSKCYICKKKFKKIGEHLFKPNCKHYPKNVRFSKG